MNATYICHICSLEVKYMLFYQHDPICYLKACNEYGLTPKCTCPLHNGLELHSSTCPTPFSRSGNKDIPNVAVRPNSAVETAKLSKDFTLEEEVTAQQIKGTHCFHCDAKITNSPYGKICIGSHITFKLCKKSHLTNAEETKKCLGLLNFYLKKVENSKDQMLFQHQSIYDIDLSSESSSEDESDNSGSEGESGSGCESESENESEDENGSSTQFEGEERIDSQKEDEKVSEQIKNKDKKCNEANCKRSIRSYIKYEYTDKSKIIKVRKFCSIVHLIYYINKASAQGKCQKSESSTSSKRKKVEDDEVSTEEEITPKKTRAPPKTTSKTTPKSTPKTTAKATAKTSAKTAPKSKK